MKGTLLSAGAAVIVQPLVFAAWFLVPLGLSGSPGEFPWAEAASMVLAVVICASIFVALLGVPLFHLLRVNHAARPRNLAVLGFVCGALPLAILAFPSSCAGCSSSATWHGRYVAFEAQGHITMYGWLSYVEGLLQFGMHGLIGALVFGFVWQRIAVQPAVQADGPAFGGPAA